MPTSDAQCEALARYLHLEACRRKSDGPEPPYLDVEAAWQQTQYRWRAIARDALAYLEPGQGCGPDDAQEETLY